MDRLLVFLFSITMLLATAPPRATNPSCDYSGGVCIAKRGCIEGQRDTCSGSIPKEKKDGCGKKSGCPLPICCVCGPCCCLCIVPERPQLHIGSSIPDEELIKPNGFQNILPQKVYFSIWKPPAFSV